MIYDRFPMNAQWLSSWLMKYTALEVSLLSTSYEFLAVTVQMLCFFHNRRWFRYYYASFLHHALHMLESCLRITRQDHSFLTFISEFIVSAVIRDLLASMLLYSGHRVNLTQPKCLRTRTLYMWSLRYGTEIPCNHKGTWQSYSG